MNNKEKMSALVDFGLSYANKVNWDKVEEVYGSKEVERLKRERNALGIDDPVKK